MFRIRSFGNSHNDQSELATVVLQTIQKFIFLGGIQLDMNPECRCSEETRTDCPGRRQCRLYLTPTQPEYQQERWSYAETSGLSLIYMSAGQAFSKLAD